MMIKWRSSAATKSERTPKSGDWKVADALDIDYIHDVSTDNSSKRERESELRTNNVTQGDEMNAEFLAWLKTPARHDRHRIQKIIGFNNQHPVLAALSKPKLSESPFKYDELQTSNDTIRLLILWPSVSREAELECSLVEASLSQTIEYDALSYAWGKNPVWNKSIRLNGKPFFVTLRLQSALLDVRTSSEPAVLWIDALCIDQKSHIESNAQVLLMSSIYGRAKRVFIWLGDVLDERIKFALWWITTLQTHYALVDLSSDEKEGLRDIIARTWFRRIWVIQEFVLAREAHFVYGPYIFFAKKLLHAYHLLEQALSFRRTTSVEKSDLHLRVLYMKQLYFYWQRKVIQVESAYDVVNTSNLASAMDLLDLEYLSGLNQSTSFLQLLAAFRHFQASRPHDKIYGLLGLASANSLLLDSAPVPDYDKPCMEVFKDWTLYFIDQYKDLSVL